MYNYIGINHQIYSYKRLKINIFERVSEYIINTHSTPKLFIQYKSNRIIFSFRIVVIFQLKKLYFYYNLRDTTQRKTIYNKNGTYINTTDYITHYSYLNFAELCSHDYHFGGKKMLLRR